ncbi:hypothetical protein [Streptomyces mirabilis]
MRLGPGTELGRREGARGGGFTYGRGLRPRPKEIHANLADRLQEAKEQGRLGEVAAIETTVAAAAQKLEAVG